MANLQIFGGKKQFTCAFVRFAKNFAKFELFWSLLLRKRSGSEHENFVVFGSASFQWVPLGGW